jgi:hypothetical protein
MAVEFPDSERPTSPINGSGPTMTIQQVKEAFSAFPPDQHALLTAMLRAADDNGFLRGAGGLTRLGPFDVPIEPKKGKKR